MATIDPMDWHLLALTSNDAEGDLAENQAVFPRDPNTPPASLFHPYCVAAVPELRAPRRTRGGRLRQASNIDEGRTNDPLDGSTRSTPFGRRPPDRRTCRNPLNPPARTRQGVEKSAGEADMRMLVTRERSATGQRGEIAKGR